MNNLSADYAGRQTPIREKTAATSEPNPHFHESFGVSDHDTGHFASDGVVMDQNHRAQAPQWSFPPLSNNTHMQLPTPRLSTSIPTGASSVAGSNSEQSSTGSSPALPTLPSTDRKRPRGSMDLSNHLYTGRDAKCMRTTPSPAPTGTTTPSSLDFDLPDDSELFHLLGGNPKDEMREIVEEQKKFEKEARDRVEQLRQDEDIARLLELQEEPYRPSSASSVAQGLTSHTPTHPFFDTARSFRPPQPPPSSRDPANLKQECGERMPTFNPSAIRREGQATASKILPNDYSNFIDLGSDDDSDAEPDYPSSDVVEIGPSSFQPRVSPSKPTTRYGNQGFAHNSGSAAKESWTDIDQTPLSDFQGSYAPLAPAYNSYQNAYNTGIDSLTTDGWPSAFNAAGQGISNAVTGALSGVNNLLNPQTITYPTSTSGRGNAYGQEYGIGHGNPYAQAMPGSFMNPEIIDLDMDYHNSAPLITINNNLSDDPYGAINVNNPHSRELYEEHFERIRNITGDPSRTAAEMRSLIENIRPDFIPPNSRVGTPESMSVTSSLYEHQKLGLTWLQKMEEGSNKGGILADDMGLGKTVQAIALMATRRSTDPDRKTTLIVAPVALLKQWEREIELRLKPGREHRLTTYIYHSRGRNITWEMIKRHDVVLTTYGTLAAELKRKEEIEMAKKGNANWRPMSANDRLTLLGDECKWYRVILDEAQCIKNRSTKAAKSAFELQSLTRFCMSGTPMMNSVNELYSLINFLRIKPYNSQERFSVDFTRPLKSSSQSAKDQAMRKLQALLKAVLLRRTKKSMIDGKPILELPERVTEIQHAVFSEDEEHFYRALETQTQLTVSKYLKAGTLGRNYSNALVLLLRLRQACCHPHLIKDFGISAGGTTGGVSVEDMLELAKSLGPDVVARIKGQGAIECPICMDTIENATIFTPCGHSTCSECFTKIQDPSQAIAEGEGNHAVKCPNCRGKVEPSKVTDYSSFKKVHMPEEAEAGNSDVGGAEGDNEENSGGDSDSESDSDEGDDLGGFIVHDDVEDDDDTDTEGYRKGNTPFEKSARKPRGKKQKTTKGKGKVDEHVKKTLAQLKAESHKNARARRKYLRRLEKDWVTSAKIEKTLEILDAVQQRKESEKTIIFSQFTSLLDLLEIPIQHKDWGYRRYDGSMSATARNDAVIDFSDKKDCKILLVSLKAGNAGLNLTAASQVILFDPFWNPYIEEQAIDRAHRIGQRLQVQVHRVLVPNTVEDRIITLQEKKRAVIEGALDEKASQSIGRLGERELAFLFGIPI